MNRSSTTSIASAAAGATATISGQSNVNSASVNPSLFYGSENTMDASMICTCVVELGPRICFATYNEENNEIIMEETPCSGEDFSAVAEKYFTLVRPNLLLVGKSIVSNEGFLEVLTRPLPRPLNESASQGERGSSDTQQQRPNAPSIPYRVLRSGAFDNRKCMAIILQKLRVLSVLKTGQTGLAMADPSRVFHSATHRSFPISNYHSLGTLIDFQSELQVKAMGALLSFLQSTIFKLESDGTITVANIIHSRSSKYMSVNAGTVAALQIFSTEHHPLMASKGRGNSKEGSSLFSLLDGTRSRGGREMLRNWMSKPLLELEEIQLRHDGVELFLSPILTDSESTVGALIGLLGEVGPITQILARLQKCTAMPMDFVNLSRTLTAANDICDILQTDMLDPLLAHAASQQRLAAQILQHGVPSNVRERNTKVARYIKFLQRILAGCNKPALSGLQDRIVSTVDEDSTVEAKDMVCIRRGVSIRLDEMKQDYANLNEIMSVTCQQIKQKHPDLGELVVVFWPQVAFLLGLRKRNVFHQVTGELRLALPQDFEHLCDSDDGYYSYFKNTDMRRLDEDIGDLDGLIKDEETLIVNALEDDILDQETELRDTFLALSELDCIISFAVIAKDRQYTRPKILSQQESSSTNIRIKGGRHPLQEILVDGRFVPNHIDIDGEKRVNVVTGPNFSGKSCYARLVGILCYMSQIGSFLPCEAAQLSIVDQILAQFSSAETCAVPQSSFQLDLTQMGTILRRATPRSLVLIDEFGKGTSPASGIALLTAALKKLTSVGVAVVCTTHFLEIFSRKLLTDGEDGIRVLRMAVHLPRGENEIAAPLFRLEQGVADSSAGIVCAQMAGLKPSVVARAKEIVVALREGKALQPDPSLILPPAVADVLKAFLSKQSWEDATDTEVHRLRHKIELL